MSSVERLDENPIIEISDSTGDSINHPSVIRVPEWVDNSLGKYYLYFSHKRGSYIRLAYADQIEGPWEIYEEGTLQLHQTPFTGHIASPDVHVDHEKEVIRLYYHGETRARDLLRSPWQNEPYRFERYGFRKREIPYRLLFNTGRIIYKTVSNLGNNFGGRSGTTSKTITESGTDTGETAQMSQFERTLWNWNLIPSPVQETRQVVSKDGINFQNSSPILGPSWFRVFEYEDRYYALARDGYLYSSSSPDKPFDRVRKLFDDHRHFGVQVVGTTLYVYYSRSRDDPEGIVRTEINLSSVPDEWVSGKTRTVLTPVCAYEGADINRDDSTQRGPAEHRNELRDPYVFTQGGKQYLFYALAGESGIGVAQMNPD